jgi:hypothetical protein
MKLLSDSIRFRLGVVSAIIAAAMLSLSACAGTGRLGGTGASQLSADEAQRLEAECEAQGAVYLQGEGICDVGEGGP